MSNQVEEMRGEWRCGQGKKKRWQAREVEPEEEQVEFEGEEASE